VQLVVATGQVERQANRVAAYIDSATTPQMNAYELNCYGYQFWLGRSLVAKREIQRSSAVVLGAQRGFVVLLEILNRYVLNSIEPGNDADWH
jgi:hypothetical protein